ncbi:MAG: hypothetical protein SCH39_03575 [Methanosarcinales archaeon]|nr:hypothetical protein [ANME-2 cluster archaeon]MDW7775402.1 hypothetical protein [Methanosarcinales archaeon]
MGSRLEAFFDQAEKKGGLAAQVKLAMLTKMSSKGAASAADSPENIKLFEDSMAKL